MAKLFNLARMNTSTTGTGSPLTLTTAVSGFLTFAQAGVANGDVVSYSIRDGAESEIGTGTYTASGTTLTRTVLKSTNSDARINLSGTAQVFITPNSQDFVGQASGVIAAEGLNWHFYLDDTASDIGGYMLLNDADPGGTPTSDSASLTTGDDQVIFSFATIAGQPYDDWFYEGVYRVRINMNLNTLTRPTTAYCRLYSRTGGGSETLVATSNVSAALTGSSVGYDFFFYNSEISGLDASQRFVLKVLANVGSGGSDGTITWDSEASCGLWAQVDSNMVRSLIANGNPLGWFNVKYYGATGDGSTDDTSAINAAITALNSAGKGVLYFPTGTYKTTGELTLTSPTAVIGCGRGSGLLANSNTKVTCTSGSNNLFVISSEGCSFSNIALECTSGTMPTVGAGILAYQNADRTTYDHVAVRGFYIDIDIQDGGEQRMIDCWLISPVKYGLKFQHTDSVDWGGLHIWGCAFYSETYDADAGIRIEGGGGINISDCAVNSWGGTAHCFNYGIDLAKDLGVSTGNLTINNTGIENYLSNGINIVTIDGNWNVIYIVSNEILKSDNSVGNAIYISASSVGQINGVIIDDIVCQTAGATAEAISLTKVNDALVGNVTMPFGYGTVLAQSGCTNIRFANNTSGSVSDNGITRYDGTGGFKLQGSAATIDDNGKINIPTGQTYDINGSPHTHAYAALAFKTVAVSGQDNVVADAADDTLTLAAGTNVTITTTAASDTVTIAASGGSLTVKEEDNSPSVSNVTEIKVTNGKLTDNGSGSVSLDLASGAGVGRSGSTTDEHLAVWNGSDADSIKDGGAVPAGSGVDGWVDKTAETWTYASASAPEFTFTISGDKTSTYQAGQRIKLTQTTVKYFIVTKVAYSAPDTTVTIYGGTDYTLANAAISANYYSLAKAPFGFPLDPAKWSVVVTDTSQRTQATPTTNQWYNLGTTACQITIPTGVWLTSIKVVCEPFSQNDAGVQQMVTLSTANNSESDADFTVHVRSLAARVVSNIIVSVPVFVQKTLTLTSSTLYYLNARTTVASVSNITFANDISKMVLTATSAYL